jgi:hypothetical protein
MKKFEHDPMIRSKVIIVFVDYMFNLSELLLEIVYGLSLAYLIYTCSHNTFNMTLLQVSYLPLQVYLVPTPKI